MPSLNLIQISDSEDEKITTKPQAASPPRQIPALATVADLNLRIEEVNTNIRSYKDDVTRLKQLLQGAEERLEKEQEKRFKLIEAKNEALDSGVKQINARESMVEVNKEVKQEPRSKAEGLRSMFAGVQVPAAASPLGGRLPTVIKTEPLATARQPTGKQVSASAARIEGHRCNTNVPMADEDDDLEQSELPRAHHQASVGTSTSGLSAPQSKPWKMTPTRGKLWQRGGAIGRASGSRSLHKETTTAPETPTASSLSLLKSTSEIPQSSKSFSREVIHSAIGGQRLHTWPTPGSGEYEIKVVRYYCLRKELNWCSPNRPGEKGLMFSSKPLGWDEESFPLFIREQTSNWVYYGDYKTTKSHIVSLQEWRGFNEAQRSSWCKHMLTRAWGKKALKEHIPEKVLKLMGPGDWKKVERLYGTADTNPRHLRITSQVLEFVRYNRELYALLETKAEALAKSPVRAKKRKIIDDDDDDDEVEMDQLPVFNNDDTGRSQSLCYSDSNNVEMEGFADDDYTPVRKTLACGNDNSSSTQSARCLKRTKRTLKRISYIEPTLNSEDESVSPQHSEKSPSPPRLPPPLPPPHLRRTRIKEELHDSDSDNMYSAPNKSSNTRVAQASAQSHSVQHRALSQDTSNMNQLRDSGRESSIEIYQKGRPWAIPTEDNERIAASEDWSRKFDSRELIKMWPKFSIPDLPWPTTKFTRRFLSRVLGGGEQMVECIISAAKQKTQIYPIKVYYCERAEWSPDLPPEPGAHGVVYATAPHPTDLDHTTDPNSSNYTLFCRRGTNQWDYCGEYQITRRKFLPGEWSRISPIAKKTWCDGFSGKRGKWGRESLIRRGLIEPSQKVTSEEVLEFINNDLLVLECQIYKCVGYKRDFYDTLQAAWLKEEDVNLTIKDEEGTADDDEWSARV